MAIWLASGSIAAFFSEVSFEADGTEIEGTGKHPDIAKRQQFTDLSRIQERMFQNHVGPS
jgi:hypothetical protein